MGESNFSIVYNGKTNSYNLDQNINAVDVSYCGNTRTFSQTGSIVLPCENKYMIDDVSIGDRILKCKSCMMASDVTINLTLSQKQDKVYIYHYSDEINIDETYGTLNQDAQYFENVSSSIYANVSCEPAKDGTGMNYIVGPQTFSQGHYQFIRIEDKLIEEFDKIIIEAELERTKEDVLTGGFSNVAINSDSAIFYSLNEGSNTIVFDASVLSNGWIYWLNDTNTSTSGAITLTITEVYATNDGNGDSGAGDSGAGDSGESDEDQDGNDGDTSERIYIFDSSREDNLIFGQYRCSDEEGEVTATASTSWPPYDDQNTSPSEIILKGTSGGGISLSTPRFMYIEPNSQGTNQTGLLANNVPITYGGKTYPAKNVGLSGDWVLYVRGYRTGSNGVGTVSYMNKDTTVGVITIDSTTEQVYSTSINMVSGADFILRSAKGSGNVIIKDIWLEEP